MTRRMASAAIVCIALTVSSCSGGSLDTSVSGPSNAPTSSANQAVSLPAIVPTVTSVAGQGQEICKVDANSTGAYYLYVTSKTADDLSACDGAVAFHGTLDDLFNIPNMDRRCILPTAGEPDAPPDAFNAIVGVYSDTDQVDLSAASQYCQIHDGSDS